MNQLDAIGPWSEWYKGFSIGHSRAMFVRHRHLANGGFEYLFKPITPFTLHIERRKQHREMRRFLYD